MNHQYRDSNPFSVGLMKGVQTVSMDNRLQGGKTCTMCGRVCKDLLQLRNHSCQAIDPRVRYPQTFAAFQENGRQLQAPQPPAFTQKPRPRQPFLSNKKTPKKRDGWMFHNGPIDQGVTANLIFTGIKDPMSLTGSCGWWIHCDNLVIACGGAIVHQNFPSLISLEYEGLLNGLQAAIRRGVKKLYITCPSYLVYTHLCSNQTEYQLPYLNSVMSGLSTIKAAIDRALKIIGQYEFILKDSETVNPTDKIARKTLLDYHENRFTQAVSKFQLQSPTTSTPSLSSTSSVSSSSSSFSSSSSSSSPSMKSIEATTINNNYNNSSYEMKKDYRTMKDTYNSSKFNSNTAYVHSPINTVYSSSSSSSSSSASLSSQSSEDNVFNISAFIDTLVG